MERRKVWRLIVWRVPPELAGLMARLKLQPSRKNPSTFWRNYPAARRAQVQAAIVLLRDSGLHGIARLVDAPERPAQSFRKQPTLVSREGFGGALNAKPIANAWRMRKRQR